MASTRVARSAAREVATGTKVILPVWHGVGAAEILEFSPILADRVGASTSRGIEWVARELSRALTTADARPAPTGQTERLVQAIPAAARARAPAGDVEDTVSLLALALVLRDKGDLVAAEQSLRRALAGGDTRLSPC